MRSEPAYLTNNLLQSHNCMRYQGCRLSGLIAFSGQPFGHLKDFVYQLRRKKILLNPLFRKENGRQRGLRLF